MIPVHLLQSCPDAIDEVFDSKLHIIGGVGITIGVVMVSVRLVYNQISSNLSFCCTEGRKQCEYKLAQEKVISASLTGVWDDL